MKNPLSYYEYKKHIKNLGLANGLDPADSTEESDVEAKTDIPVQKEKEKKLEINPWDDIVTNVRNFVVHNIAASPASILLAVIYSVFYTTILLFIANILLKKKEI